MDEALIRSQLNNTLVETDFPELGSLYRGKVRDNYTTASGLRIIIASDRLSAFDRVLTSIPFKGQLLNQMTAFWFERTKDVVPNHVVEVPDPNVMVVSEAQPLPIEMVIRGYITGSAWRAYENGELVSGIVFPEGLLKNQQLAEPVITPTTKAVTGHDEAISREEILAKEIIPEETYAQMEEMTFKLFEAGSRMCADNNIILVDTKYEFGLVGDQLVVIDEIHTPDSSRFWIKGTYQDLFSAGEEPEILDKEFFRGWLMDQGYMGDGVPPEITDDVRVELAQRYAQAFQTITGQDFEPPADDTPILERIKANLTKYFP
ncbi:MAG TPA: phosphoribosylaminoimidazolesuccinocarboxamide synthase [Candidatus Lokiarchaeia archaeon]|nr:phosphoribosylaminoimidazolesuccinocarboxamide synthase [Candidatus Lokiarchaeia archaeon]